MTAKMPTEAQRNRAEKLGRLAAREGKSVTVCPFPVNGAPADRVLAARFVVGYVAAGGVVDGMAFGDEDQADAPKPKPWPGGRAERRAMDRGGRPFDHLGY